MRTNYFAVGIAIRTFLFGALFVGSLAALFEYGLYGVAATLVLFGAAVLVDLSHYIRRTDRLLEAIIDDLIANQFTSEDRIKFAQGPRGLRETIGCVADALKRFRAEKQKQIDKLQTLLDTVPVAIALVRDDTIVTPANLAARSLIGPRCYLDDLAGERLLHELTPGEQRVVRLKNGQRQLVVAALFSTQDDSLTVLTFAAIGSELDAAESRAWRELVRVLSHEMLNSLTPITSLTDSLKKVLTSVETTEGIFLTPVQVGSALKAIETIARRSLGLTYFVERYRQVAREPHVSLVSVNIDTLLEHVSELLGPMLKGQKIAYRATTEPPGLAVMADAELLMQALINLIHNAIDAVREVPDPQIEVICTSRSPYAAIEVRDNGCGITTDLDKIFVPYFTTKKAKGSGIGLTLTRQIMQAHGGTVEVRALLPRGSAFTLLAPTTFVM